nr:hypothetical protein [Tanacetum cinerariifolium]
MLLEVDGFSKPSLTPMDQWIGKFEKLVVLIYVDDLIITRNNEDSIKKVKNDLQQRFPVKDLGPLKYFLGIELATSKAEYRAMATTSCEMVWLKRLLNNLGCTCSTPMTLFCDNQAAIHIAANPVFHERTKYIEGRIKDFSVYEVWNDIRSRNVLVPWSRLRTHDILNSWKRDDDLCCVFCKDGPDSHNHLFFECGFPKEVWCRPINKSIWSILQRLLLGATVYTVWQERNLRMFQNRKRSVDMVCNIVKDMVRLRVLSLSLNPSV